MEFRVGVAGCGRMGLPMAQALHRAGFDTLGFDVRSGDAFTSFGEQMCFDPAAFVAERNVLITVVRDIQQTNALLFDDQALLLAAPELRYLIICSTLSPRYLQSLRHRVPDHITLIDAPMSGAAIAAQEARLSFMLGGSSGDIETLMSLFEAMGTKFHHMGDFGSGMATKVLNNLVAASSVATTRLTLEWAQAQGLDIGAVLAVMNDSSGQTWFGSNFGKIEFSRDGFDRDNTIGILKKDMESALDAMPPGGRGDLPRALIEEIEQLKAWDQ
jgi:3-hydroxyisobutyrate dehydrogenase-like beta-hydroxyacid dehydrogenase